MPVWEGVLVGEWMVGVPVAEMLPLALPEDDPLELPDDEPDDDAVTELLPVFEDDGDAELDCDAVEEPEPLLEAETELEPCNSRRTGSGVCRVCGGGAT